MIEQTYIYDFASELSTAANGSSLKLASDRHVAATPPFLKARARFPDVTAKSLRAVSEIVGARFYVPPSMLARILREADPVATVGANAVRFEGFSACCSAYIRLDLDNDALETQQRCNGTTNVDFGPELRGALSAVAQSTEMEISIGASAVEITTDGNSIIEKKVPLPLRWIKGFAEVQGAIAGMQSAFTLPKIAAQRFLRGLPRGKNDQRLWVTAVGSTARVSARGVRGAVPLRGSHRLRVFDPLAALADSLVVHCNPATGATCWTLEFGAQRLSLVLNAEPWRGFSGDGAVLRHLANADTSGVAAIAAQLNWQDQIDKETFAIVTGLSAEAVEGAFARLAAGGRLGFDQKRQAYFHRDLPFDMEAIEGLNPRLKSAKALLDKGGVRWINGAAEVTSSDVIHTVTPDNEGWRCTCPWFAKNGNQRGPCKHILAAEMELHKHDD